MCVIKRIPKPKNLRELIESLPSRGPPGDPINIKRVLLFLKGNNDLKKEYCHEQSNHKIQA